MSKLDCGERLGEILSREFGDVIMRKLIVVVAAASALLVACNTLEGVGKDMTSAGKAVSQTAQDARK